MFFPDAGAVSVSLPASKMWQIKWLDLERTEWQEAQSVSGGEVELIPPGAGYWISIIE